MKHYNMKPEVKSSIASGEQINDELISMIIPVYNSADFIESCIQNVMQF